LPAVAMHAVQLRLSPRQAHEAHGGVGRDSIVTTLPTLRHRVADPMLDAARAFRAALLDLRHGVDVVRVLREAARLEELFAVIRWCDDWLGARRTLVARVEAQLAWFAEQPHPEDREETHVDRQ